MLRAFASSIIVLSVLGNSAFQHTDEAAASAYTSSARFLLEMVLGTMGK